MRDARFGRFSRVWSPLESHYKAGPRARLDFLCYRLDFLFLVSRVIITLPGHLFRGTAVIKGNEAPILCRDD